MKIKNLSILLLIFTCFFLPTYSLAASAAEQHPLKKEAQAGSTEASVNINKADASELQTLDGIGPKKAEKIIQYRQQHGDFKSVEDLKNIKGINDKILKKNQTRITTS